MLIWCFTSSFFCFVGHNGHFNGQPVGAWVSFARRRCAKATRTWRVSCFDVPENQGKYIMAVNVSFRDEWLLWWMIIVSCSNMVLCSIVMVLLPVFLAGYGRSSLIMATNSNAGQLVIDSNGWFKTIKQLIVFQIICHGNPYESTSKCVYSDIWSPNNLPIISNYIHLYPTSEFLSAKWYRIRSWKNRLCLSLAEFHLFLNTHLLVGSYKESHDRWSKKTQKKPSPVLTD